MPVIYDRRRSGKRKTRSRPDDVAQVGPVRIERHGRLVVAKNLAPPDYFEAIREWMPSHISEIEALIRSNIVGLIELLRDIEPIGLLSHAFSTFYLAHLGIEDEPSVRFDEHTLPARLIDYGQSIFTSLQPNTDPRDHSQDDFDKAAEYIRIIFESTRELIFLRAHFSGNENTAFNDVIAKLLYHWIFIRSDRHSYFEVAHYRDLLEPLDAILRRVLGVSADSLIAGIETILALAQRGLGEAAERIHGLHQAAIEHPDFLELLTTPEADRLSVLEKWSGTPQSDIHAAFENMFGTRIFDVGRATEWPSTLLDSFSYSQGDTGQFLEPPDDAAWPTRVWPIFRRPFIKVADKHYCFDHIAFVDRFYRQLLRQLRAIDPDCGDELNAIQSKTAEEIAETLIRQILPTASVYRNVYYQIGSNWFEADILVLYKDVLLVFEVRSGSVTPESPGEDLASYLHSIENLIFKPASQAWRLIKALQTDVVSIYDSNGPKRELLLELDGEEFPVAVPVAVSLDHLFMLGAHYGSALAAADAAHPPVWSITIDDLRCFSHLFESEVVFSHFVEMRLKAAAEPHVEVLDELDHLGMYFIENDYIAQTESFDGNLQRFGYTSAIDRYFFLLGTGDDKEADAVKPTQEMPEEIKILIRSCDTTEHKLSRLLGSRILGADGETRAMIASFIREQLNSCPAERFRSLTISFEPVLISLNIARTWSIDLTERAILEAEARLMKSVKSEHLQVVIFQGSESELDFIDCYVKEKSELSEQRKAILAPIDYEQRLRACLRRGFPW